jgi:hypothetical protein
MVLAVMLTHFGIHFDADQFSKGVTFSALGPAIVKLMFSFVGFESATTLGAETRDPLRQSAAVIRAVLAGIFFMLCSYSEVLGFRGESGRLSESTVPCTCAQGRPSGVAIDFGAFISMGAYLRAQQRRHGCSCGWPTDGYFRCIRAHEPATGTPGIAITVSAGLMFPPPL